MSTESEAPSAEITYLGHSCVLVEVPRPGGGRARLLLDPGNLSPALTDIGRIDAVLVTHAHPDHIDASQVKRIVDQQGTVPVYGPAAALETLSSPGVTAVAVEPGLLDVSGISVSATKTAHETIYAGVPLPENIAYDIGGFVFAPGDSLATPESPVDVLLAPLAGPWMKLSEAIDYVRRTEPRIVVPIHDGGLAAAHRNLHRMLVSKFAPEGTEVRPLGPGETLSLGSHVSPRPAR